MRAAGATGASTTARSRPGNSASPIALQLLRLAQFRETYAARGEMAYRGARCDMPVIRQLLQARPPRLLPARRDPLEMARQPLRGTRHHVARIQHPGQRLPAFRQRAAVELFIEQWRGQVAQREWQRDAVVLRTVLAALTEPATVAFRAKELLETQNDFAHYGLVRDPSTPVQPRHSWNSNGWMSTNVLYSLARHSHHHAEANEPYYARDAHVGAPRLPGGYLLMIPICLVPPLYKRLMTRALNDRNRDHATAAERELARQASLDSGMRGLALAHGVAFPHNCRVGGCASRKCRLVRGKVRELTDKSHVLSADELRQDYILACQSLPLGDVEVEVALVPDTAAAVSTVRGRIERVEALTHDIRLLRLALDEALPFRPGRYAEVSLADAQGNAVTRSYSFANIPDADGIAGTAEFIIRHVPGGAFTDWLFAADRTGASLAISSPHGDFGVHEDSASMLCVAGGSGLAPILSLLHSLACTRSAQPPVTLVFGARTHRDLYLLDGIEAMRRDWRAGFRFEPVLSHEPATSDWAGRRGWIADHLVDIAGSTLAAHHAYLCGPPPMIDGCLPVLAEAGMPEPAISFDRFLDRSHTSGVLAKAG